MTPLIAPPLPSTAGAPLPAAAPCAPPLPPLLDRFGRPHTYLRISLTERCNLRCRYCMPADGIPLRPRDELLTFDEIVRLARLMARMGVDKIRLTGGEPTVRRDLPELIARLATIPGIDSLAMTTNGLTLAERAAEYRAAGLGRINISLDTLRPERFERITRRPGRDRVLAGIDAALAAGLAPVKLNMVVIGSVNDDELADFAALTRDRPLHVRFIEYMPFAGNGWDEAGLVPATQMRARIAARYELLPLGDAPHAVAREFRIPGHRGTVGFISSMTDHFCGGCNRIRLTARGEIKNCLFKAPAASLRDLLRAGATDACIASAIRGALDAKWERHPPLHELAAASDRAMVQIGG